MIGAGNPKMIFAEVIRSVFTSTRQNSGSCRNQKLYVSG